MLRKHYTKKKDEASQNAKKMWTSKSRVKFPGNRNNKQEKSSQNISTYRGLLKRNLDECAEDSDYYYLLAFYLLLKKVKPLQSGQKPEGFEEIARSRCDGKTL